MKRLTKYLLAFSLAATAAMPLTQAVFADEGEEVVITPVATANSSNSAAVNIYINDTEIKSVTAYQVLKGDYNDHGFIGYIPANEAIKTLLDLDNNPLSSTYPSYTEVSTMLANKDTYFPSGGVALTSSPITNGLKFSGNLNAGTYIIQIIDSGNSTTIYEPLLISLEYTSATSDELKVGTVDHSGNWTLSNGHLKPKSFKPTVDKKIEDFDDDQESANGAAFDFKKPIHFTVETAIPSYDTSVYENKLTFKITDEFSEGLTKYEKDPTDTKDYEMVVAVGGVEVAAGPETYTLTWNTGNDGYELGFADLFIRSHVSQVVTLSYYAMISDESIANFDGTNNTVNVQYSNNPNQENSFGEIDDKTYQYTFDIDGKLFGSSTTQENEIIKTGEAYETIPSDPVTENQPLAGAEFSIWNSNKNYDKIGNSFQTVTTDADGLMNFKGLDAGYYVIQETKAPDGYSLNNTPVKVQISATYFDDGQLKSYTILVNENKTSTYTMGNKGDTSSITKGPDESEEIKNTKIPGLPSTGGMGTWIYSGVGLALMAGGFAVISRKRKKAE